VGLIAHIRDFLRDHGGNATVEFVIVFPVVMIVFVAAFESGMLLTRQVIMEKALDGAVRELRLRSDLSTTHAEIRDVICDNAPVINNCQETLTLDLRVVDQDNYLLPDEDSLCVERDGEVNPANRFSPGAQNQLMLVRACAVVERILPLSGIGLNLTRDDNGDVHIQAASVFVNEPD